MSPIKLRKEPRLDRKLSAFSYQLEAYNAVKELPFAAIFHEQGLGKTKIAIDVLLYWLETRAIDTVLIVAKKSLVQNWISEIAKHSHITPQVLTQMRGQNYYVFNSPSRLVLAHYEVIKSEVRRFKLFLKARDIGVVLDESTKIKNPSSALTRSFFELSPLFKRKLILTGTPIANRPYDIWSQIFFLDSGKSLGADFADFRGRYDLNNDLAKSEQLRAGFEDSLNELMNRIGSFSVRKTKQDGVIQLPEKVHQTISCDWEPHQFRLYEQIRVDTHTVVIKNGALERDDSEAVLKRLLRLVQATSNPRLFDEGYKEEPGKLPYLRDLIDRIVAGGEKCIVWSSFIANVNWLAELLGEYGSARVHGKMSIDARNRSLKRFANSDKTRILVATPGAAKEGLTLTIANHVVYFDRTFSLDDYLQSQDRIHRISQKKKCYVYKLVMEDSIDEWVDLLLNCKHLAAQLAQGDVSEEYYQRTMSYDFANVIGEILNARRG